MSRRTMRAVIAAWLAAVLLPGSVPAGDIGSEFAAARRAFDAASRSGDPDHAGYADAYGVWKRLAEAGHIPSLYHLGILNLYGLGGARFDQIRAFKRIRAAAEGGYFIAQSFMGFLYETSDGAMVNRDERAALSWYRKGAENGHCVAVRRLAAAYEKGQLGLAPDAAQAADWRTKKAGCRSH